MENELRGYQVETCSGPGGCPNRAIVCEGLAEEIGKKCLSCGKCIAICPTGTLRADSTGYRILLGGKLGRHPRLGTELPGIYEKNTILDIIDRCVEYYKNHCVEGERLGEIMRKNKQENILKYIIPVIS